jgi:thymidylate kinase
MKIAFIGTHGVGKTTLCFDLAARLKKRDLRVEMVREVARQCPLPINRESSVPAQSWIFHTQLAEEIAAEAKSDFVICDRSVIDNYCYLLQTGRVAELEPLARWWLPTYDFLIKVPIVAAPRFDGVRDTGLEFQKAIDETLDQVLEKWAVSHRRLDPERRDDWADDALAWVLARVRGVQETLFEEP